MTLISNHFVRRLSLVLASAVIVGLLLAAVVLAADIWPLLFGAVLVCLFLRGLSGWVCSHTRLGPRSSLASVVLVLAAAMGVAMWRLAPQALTQAEQFIQSLPRFVESARQAIARLTGGPELVEGLENAGQGELLGQAADALSLLLDGLVAFIVVVIGGLYLAAEADLYRRGLVRLFPVRLRGRTDEVLIAMGAAVQRFLLGRVVSMMAVGVSTGALLSLLEIPLAVILGIVAGVLTFVPYAGPIVASIPIGLVAITEGTTEFVYAMGLYAAIQAVEGFIITPLVQERAVNLPPFVTLGAEVLMGMVFGAVGVVISVPLAAALLVLVRMAWVEGVLERTEPWRRAGPPS